METVTLPRFLEPKLLSSHFHIEPGSVVGDFGAGAGKYLPYVVNKVGKHGKVVACEALRELVDILTKQTKSANYDNVDVLWCDIATTEGTRIDAESLDFVLLINTLYQIPERETAVSEVYRTLRPGGIVYVVDWLDSFNGIGPYDSMVCTRDSAIDLFESQYFIYEREYPAGGYHYGLAFRKI